MLLTPLYPGGKLKALTFSYDDGRRADERLVGIFNRWNLKATFNLCSGATIAENKIHKDEFDRVYSGHEIASHSVRHPFLERIPRSCALNQLVEDRRELERITNKIINGFALPYGTWSPDVLETLRSVGYLYSRTCCSTKTFTIPADFLEWHPTCHHREIPEIGPMFKNCRYPLALCYIWGHSWEFDKYNNWDLIENFCEDISREENIWFATNGEIVRYLLAWKQIETSINSEIIYNPTAISLWVQLESGEIIELESGETKKITP